MTTKKENDEQPITDISIYVAALSSTYRQLRHQQKLLTSSLPPR
uniref:Uncharacterized protein n=1 Tax=Siphoviridae sp. ctyU16 TaxID=2827976 RepID=A0A8S5TNW3_9CAUD|nr:MAG TPA: hypothetical protein [Siphoviridae sp. ctyU16]